MKRSLYIGTYTLGPNDEKRTEGIFLCQMDTENGRIEKIAGFDAGPNPGYLAFHPSRSFLYAANELGDGKGEASAFSIDPQSLRLEKLNHQPVQGADPCYVSLDPSGRWLLVACYSSGSLAVLPIQADGRLGPLAQRVQNEGKGVNAERQEKAHAHSIRFDPSGRFVLSADLGTDRVWVYRLDEKTGRLTPNDPPGLDGTPGAGPRHLEFDRSGKFLYISNELDSTVTACAWDSRAGTVQALQSLSTLPLAELPDPQKVISENTVADLHITPSGKYLYVSNRGHNSIAGYRIDAATGMLTPNGFCASGGNWPRNFAVDPDGTFLIVANQYSQDLCSLRIQNDGSLTDTGERLSIPAPVCVLFA